MAVRRSERARGLLGRSALALDEALLIPRASSVHTFGMRFPILVARLDEALRVKDARVVPPRRLVLPSRRAWLVLEAGAALDLRAGDRLRVVGAGLAILPPLPPGRGRGRARRARAPIV
ncbi:MAG TPA: DUF192 domain-containing protein [Actinomycetota bacterium]|nr:DUF192 domain-containing protein [Actinomycetota bacterium]